jgi:iron complex outermembrane recepter protein
MKKLKNKLIIFLIFLTQVVIGQENLPNGYTLDKDTIQLNEVSINGNLPFQATSLTPITFKNLTKQDIQIKNYGQEPSQILMTTPSITSYSDAGSSWGYSYIRLRGIDQTRINMTLNGVPLNEPEDQGVYFSNYPDFFQSVELLQIQRGQGMSKNGTSSYGGSMNFESYRPDDFNATVLIGYGYWNALKLSGKSECQWKRGGYYVQLSDIGSDGYKYHSGNHARSVFMVGNYNMNKNYLKLVGFAGEQQNELSWIGSPMDSIQKDRQYNACSKEENDYFNQYHIQFHHLYKISDNSKFNYCVYYNYLKGWYTFDVNNFIGVPPPGDFLKYSIYSNFIGSYVNYYLKIKDFSFYTGVNGYLYNRKHVGSEKTIGELYQNTGYRDEFSLFVKGNYNIKNFNIFTDLQYRFTDFKYSGDATLPYFNWNFFNYSVGVDYKLKNNIFYYNIGRTHREPTRNDIFMGSDNLMSDSLGNPIYNDIKPETVLDQELGYRFIKNKLNINLNLFYMIFNDEIVLNGQFGPTGLPLHENVAESYRSGVEFDFRYKFDVGIGLVNNTTYNYSQIDQSGINITPVLTPKWIVNQEVNYNYKWFLIGFSYRYQDFSYIDFGNQYKISGFQTLNTIVGFKFNHWLELDFYLNNITNSKYISSGQLNYDGTIPLYFVSAPFNCFGIVKISL